MIGRITERHARLPRRVSASIHSQASSEPGPSRRHYSTASKPSQAPAAATATATSSTSHYQHSPIPPWSSNFDLSSAPLSSTLFSNPPPRTVLPPPLPDDVHSSYNTFLFPESRLQESQAVIDACLHDCHDVPRAQAVLADLQRQAQRRNEEVPLYVGHYNAFLNAFMTMATQKDPDNRSKWVAEAWDMYASLLISPLDPNAQTFSLMLLFLTRFAPSSPLSSSYQPNKTYMDLLEGAIAEKVSCESILEALTETDISRTEQSTIVRNIQQWAVARGNLDIVNSINKIVEKAPIEEDDPLHDLPVVQSVKKPDPEEHGYRRRKSAEDAKDILNVTLAENPSETPFNLSQLQANLAAAVAARKTLGDDAIARQKLLEGSAMDAAEARIRHAAERMEAVGLGNTKEMNKKSVRAWMWAWLQALVPRLETEIQVVAQQEAEAAARARTPSSTPPLTPFLTLLKPKKLALITIMELMRLQGSGGVAAGMKTARALISVGQAVELEYAAEVRRARQNKLASQRGEAGTRADETKDVEMATSNGIEGMQARRQVAREQEKNHLPWGPPWTQAVRVRVGSMLVDALMDTAEVERTMNHPETGETYRENQPAFYHAYEYVRGKKLGVIKLNPDVAEHFATGGAIGTLHPRHLPMLVPPRPWISHDNGAYLYNKSSAMRIKDSQEQLTYLRVASQERTMELVFQGLDVLGSTAWVINDKIFRVMLDIWNQGIGLAKIPPIKLDIEDPEKPADYDSMSASAKSKWLATAKEVILARRNNHSDRCHVNYKLEIARAFLGERFYLPHNIDFRGRAYPIPPHLNHIGDDLSRGLLKFADTKPLGEQGLRWLKIHLSNLYGYDKASFDERETWVMERLEHIYDSATNPLGGNRWWLKADDPWQCLAACIELHAALESGNPLAYESNLPVHQDGTCNGLQHYAALGGDRVGAQQVNLDVTDRPSDVYTFVANMVEKQIAADVAKGDKVAMLLEGKVSRKVVKQTVMTTVYGVTYIGARAQIEKQLRDRGDIDRDEIWTASSYLARAVLGNIANLFAGAKGIQNWLHDSARLVAKSIRPDRLQEAQQITSTRGKSVMRTKKEQMTTVTWTTPLGLPIVQPYRKLKRKQIMTGLQSVYIADPNAQSEVNPIKQASAFPPNFIHSLDATHMMLTALECKRQSLTFASVHDSYWTHASSVNDMSKIIRSTFIHLHSSDIMNKLQAEFAERYKGYAVPVSSLAESEIARINADGVVTIKRQSAKRPKAKASAFTGPPASQKGAKSASVSSLTEEDATEMDGEEAEEEIPVEQMTETVVVSGGDEQVFNVPTTEGKEAGADAAGSKRGMEIIEHGVVRSTGPAYKQYVTLEALMPKLPKKGDFNVEAIKNSMYFFS